MQDFSHTKYTQGSTFPHMLDEINMNTGQHFGLRMTWIRYAPDKLQSETR